MQLGQTKADLCHQVTRYNQSEHIPLQRDLKFKAPKEGKREAQAEAEAEFEAETETETETEAETEAEAEAMASQWL